MSSARLGRPNPLLFLYFVLAGVTWVSSGVGVGRGFLGRFALPDVVLLLLAAPLFILAPSRVRFSPVASAAAFLFVVFGVGIAINSQNLQFSLMEWLVHWFGLVAYVTVFSLAVRGGIDERLGLMVWWVRATAVLALVGVYDLLAATFGLPGIASSLGYGAAAQGAVVGTFRNTGQAGVFFVVALAVAIPLQRVVTGARRLEMGALIGLLLVTSVLTVKRSALIGLVLGLLFLLVRDTSWKGRARTLLTAGIGLAIVIPAVLVLLQRSGSFAWRIRRKVGGAAALGQVASFAGDNTSAASEALSRHPIFGAGLGGIHGVYTAKYEIHSTYLSVAASGGAVGIIAYACFVFVLFRFCTRPRNADPRARQFGRLFGPLLVGLMVCFVYTYHLRKREFWVTAALASALMAPVAGANRRAPVAATTPKRARPEPAGAAA